MVKPKLLVCQKRQVRNSLFFYNVGKGMDPLIWTIKKTQACPVVINGLQTSRPTSNDSWSSSVGIFNDVPTLLHYVGAWQEKRPQALLFQDPSLDCSTCGYLVTFQRNGPAGAKLSERSRVNVLRECKLTLPPSSNTAVEGPLCKALNPQLI